MYTQIQRESPTSLRAGLTSVAAPMKLWKFGVAHASLRSQICFVKHRGYAQSNEKFSVQEKRVVGLQTVQVAITNKCLTYVLRQEIMIELCKAYLGDTL